MACSSLKKDAQSIQDIEDFCVQKPKTHIFRSFEIKEDQYKIIRNLVIDYSQLESLSDEKLLKAIWKKYQIPPPPKPRIMDVYLNMIEVEKFPRSKILDDYLISHVTRAASGVSVCAVFLSPYPNGQKFSCRWNCSYCPDEPGQPRSYLFGEPGVLRANQNEFDCVRQIHSRIRSLILCGHPADKFEILILGGTIHSYPEDYLEEFFRDIFYAANTCSRFEFKSDSRERLTLKEEQDINEHSNHRIIGVTVETRPDCINKSELIKFRRWGVTRVQIGAQTTHDDILKSVNRGHGLKHTLRACQLLRDSCFKFDIHLMPNLPNSTPNRDIEMMNYVLTNIHPDQVKMYPTTITPFTKILEDYKTGKYVPYNNDDLERVILYWLKNVHPWIRNNRIVRDIPTYYIVDGVKSSNQKQEFDVIMKEKGLKSHCIRSREAGRVEGASPKSEDPNDGELVVREYEAQDGKEYFISWESKPIDPGNDSIPATYHTLGYIETREVLFGFVRLRITKNQCIDIFPELENCALVRELHVYGKTMSVSKINEGGEEVQHIGIGKTLMNKAEEIAKEYGYPKICVIAGIGTRNYYRKLGYENVETFMIKNI
jgi:ELP3 family radical SAM enzyme/protein acetyltransferase